MEYEWLEYELKHSPSLKLIRSDHVGFIVSFLVKQLIFLYFNFRA
jgi:hypothetical protein